jgi:3-hydroxyisobutyrate dehydrogenase-like beta-hydroxyacid dehydrogenase
MASSGEPTATGAAADGRQTQRPVVAVLGTGIMGSAMARRLIAADLPVQVWNRDPSRARSLVDAARSSASIPRRPRAASTWS